MTKNTIQSLLHLLAVASVFYSIIKLSNSLLMGLQYHTSDSDFYRSSESNPLHIINLLHVAVPMIWGFLLYGMAPKLAAHIHSQLQDQSSASG